jgi:hypothetical protein
MTGTRTGFINVYVFDGDGLEPKLAGKAHHRPI